MYLIIPCIDTSKEAIIRVLQRYQKFRNNQKLKQYVNEYVFLYAIFDLYTIKGIETKSQLEITIALIWSNHQNLRVFFECVYKIQSIWTVRACYQLKAILPSSNMILALNIIYHLVRYFIMVIFCRYEKIVLGKFTLVVYFKDYDLRYLS